MADSLLLEDGSFLLLEDGASHLLKERSAFAMVADTVAFDQTGNAAALTKQFKIAAGIGALTETGNAATLTHQRRLALTVGTFAETGNAAVLSKTSFYTLIAASVAFALTGSAAALVHTRKIAAGIASFTETGTATALRATRQLAVTVGTFAETGNAAVINYQRRIGAGVASFTETAAAAGLTHPRYMAAVQPLAVPQNFAASNIGAAPFDLTGHNTALYKFPPTLVAEPAFTAPRNVQLTLIDSDESVLVTWEPGPSYAVNTSDTALRAARRLSLATASFTETGNAALLGSARHLEMTAASASFVLAGNAAALQKALGLAAGQGAFVYSLRRPPISRSMVRGSASGTFGL
jgi:hypothetical protein